jgi:diguanylate cyclase
MNMNEPPHKGRATESEIARRALKAIGERKLVPTPEVFSEVYFEMAGGRPGAASPAAVLKEVLRDLVRAGRLASAEAVQILEQGNKSDWLAVRDALDKALARRTGATGGSWPHAALTVLRQTDLMHANWTRARKVDAVARVVEAAVDQPDVALDRLLRLVESWGPAIGTLPRPEVAEAPLTQPAPPAGPDDLPVARRYGSDPQQEAALRSATVQAEAWRQVALRAMRVLEHTCGQSAAEKLREYATQHGRDVPAEDADKLLPRFVDVVTVIDREIGEQQKVRIGLQRLLALLCDNMKNLTPEEAWLAGQLEPIRSILAGPLSSLQLAQAEQTLAGVIQQQAGARRSLQDAKLALKEMLASLVERIGSMSSSTGRFVDQVGGYQRELENASDFETLSRVIKGLLADTQIVRSDMQASRAELQSARAQVEAYESRVRELERELTQVSTLVQKDPLTHALNRRGLEDAFRVETARARRYRAPLGLLMIDLDDFKRLNDSLGHAAGDKALVHLAQIMQATLRPTDLVARLGGEEFAVLFPATDLEDTFNAGVRLQRELARRPFSFEAQQVSVAFSGGAAMWREQDTLEQLIKRADELMYQAKRAGKNRVLKES